MAVAGVKTAHSEIVDNPAKLDEALDRFGPNWVVKDDGLAAGKGVVVTTDRLAARDHAAELLETGHPVLLESFLDGPEVSLFCLVDGDTVIPLLPAQDHKRVGDGDSGPNTGGMGAYTPPLPWLPDEMVMQIVDDVVKPVAAELVARGSSFSGLLYAGLAIGVDGPAVVEFNCRFGDPRNSGRACSPRNAAGRSTQCGLDRNTRFGRSVAVARRFRCHGRDCRGELPVNPTHRRRDHRSRRRRSPARRYQEA